MLTPTGIYRYRLANTEFLLSVAGEGSTASEFKIRKPADALQLFPQLRSLLRFKNVMQLIDDDLGSVALTVLVGAPSSIIVISTRREPIEPLLEFAARRGIDDRLTVHRGVQLDDHAQLAELADTACGGAGLDVVIDDVSTSLPTAEAAFATLFPRLPPGGSYVLQRWAWHHLVLDESLQAMDPADPDANQRAIQEAVSAVQADVGETAEAIMPKVIAASRGRPDVVASVWASRHWLVVTRGPTRVDEDFSLDSLLSPG